MSLQIVLQHSIMRFILCSFLTLPSFTAASPIPFADRQIIWHPVVMLTGGAAFVSDLGESKNFLAQNGIFSFYNYSADRTDQTQAVFGIFLGGEVLLDPQWGLQVGLSYYQPSDFDVKGVITQGIDIPSSNQYDYKYDIQTKQLLAESKLFYNYNRCYHPYLSAGIGAALNKSKNFQVNVVPPFTSFSPVFSEKTETSFTYSIGVGIDVNLTDNTRLGLGYRFTDLGAAKTGNGVIDDVGTNYALSQSHFYANEVVAQFTYYDVRGFIS